MICVYVRLVTAPGWIHVRVGGDAVSSFAMEWLPSVNFVVRLFVWPCAANI